MRVGSLQPIPALGPALLLCVLLRVLKQTRSGIPRVRVEPYLHGGGESDCENIPAPPASDWSIVRIYLRFLRLIGYSVCVEPHLPRVQRFFPGHFFGVLAEWRNKGLTAPRSPAYRERGGARADEGGAPSDGELDRLVGQECPEALLRLDLNLRREVDEAELLGQFRRVGHFQCAHHALRERALSEVQAGGVEDQLAGGQLRLEDEVNRQHLVRHVDPHGHLDDTCLHVGILAESLEQPLGRLEGGVEVAALT
eukprot:1195318-Prorocentrum_minimum.AAC.4